MTARQKLLEIANTSLWGEPTILKGDKEALRAVDQLLQDCCRYFEGYYTEAMEVELLKRARALGYNGESK